MRFLALALVALLLCTPAARAQQLIADYYAVLSTTDMFNSSGARLGDFGAILQQDRANFHRFGRADDGDQFDPVFGNRQFRGMIPQIWAVGRGSEYIPDWVVSGRTRYVRVQVFGINGVPTQMVVHEGAG